MNVYMSARTQFSNLGDLVINKVLILILLSDKNNHIFLNISGVPDKYITLLEINLPKDRVEFKKTSSFYKSLLINIFKKNIVLLKPGGYVASRTIKNKIRRLAQGVMLALYRVLGITIIRAPSSQEKSTGFDFIIDKFRFNFLTKTFARDQESSLNLKRLGLKVDKVSDMAEIISNQLIYKQVFSNLPLENKNKKKIAISLRDRTGIHSLDFAKIIGDYEGVYISQVIGDEKIYKNNKSLSGLHIFSYELDLQSAQKIMNEYSNSKYIVSNRLHSLILALVVGAIPIALVTNEDAKVRSMMTELGLKDCIFNLSEFEKIDSKILEELDYDYLKVKTNLINRSKSTIKKILKGIS